ncbi:MAG: lysophospholipid acyltransferase family protein [Bacteroidota bacterium]|jgi:KDO2-lipid IV(A) lauroyltransferase
MYYLIYGILKLLSLIPLRILYIISDFVYILIYYIVQYRKSVVLTNLKIAFPEKSAAEHIAISKKFYRNLSDTFIEIIKMFSWNENEIRKRFTGNMEVLNRWAGKEKSIQVVSGHFFNWEMANLSVSSYSEIPFLGVYMPLTNKTMNKIFYDLRCKFGTILIPATDFKNKVAPYFKKQSALILVADQNPAGPENGWWLYFFSRPAPFVPGPSKGAIARDTVIIYANYYKIKRGYYKVEFEEITQNPADFTEASLTYLLAKKVESSIKERPDNYLWTHRRWKHQWNSNYINRWADMEKTAPE